MLAVVEIEGFQYEVEPNAVVKTQLLQKAPGETVEFEKVLFVEKDGEVVVGNPYVQAKVVASVVAHGKEPKVIVFKKKRRKNYRRLRGHRQPYTLLEIKEISLS
ncbi:MAG: 50S ribosomal protein L21 [Ignavibacteria bacterium]|nr:50S ribosomal protein L21 [Ignavibacteria bacterium]